MTETDFEAALEAIRALGLLSEVQPLEGPEHRFWLTGQLEIGNQHAQLLLDLSPPFPLRLPQMFLIPWDAFGYIPHVQITGLICYQDKEGLVLDQRRPAQVATEALTRAIRTIRNGVDGQNLKDFADEFDVYWQARDGAQAHSMLDAPSQMTEIVLVRLDNGPSLLAQSLAAIASFFNHTKLSLNFSARKVHYVPLQKKSILIPPRPDQQFWTIEEIRQKIWPLISPPTSRALLKALRRPPREEEVLIFGLPRPAGGISLFGIEYLGAKKKHPFLEGGKAETVRPLILRRLDKSYLVPRGGGNLKFGSKRVLIAGLGSVGGHVAFEMTRAGVLNLTLVDHDTLDPENTFRHVLGRGHWGQKKTEAVKKVLETQFPYVKVESIVGTIEHALESGRITLRSYDLALIALGNPTAELTVNMLAHERTNNPPVVFTWLEPFGIGGHALLTNNSPGGGCFECLYTSPVGEPCDHLSNRASFAAPGQSFGISLTGCGSLHTPYGSTSVMQTVALAVQLAIDALTGQEKGNPLRSWKGDPAWFLREGFQLSSRYHSTVESLARDSYSYAAINCKACQMSDGYDHLRRKK